MLVYINDIQLPCILSQHSKKSVHPTMKKWAEFHKGMKVVHKGMKTGWFIDVWKSLFHSGMKSVWNFIPLWKSPHFIPVWNVLRMRKALPLKHCRNVEKPACLPFPTMLQSQAMLQCVCPWPRCLWRVHEVHKDNFIKAFGERCRTAPLSMLLACSRCWRVVGVSHCETLTLSSTWLHRVLCWTSPRILVSSPFHPCLVDNFKSTNHHLMLKTSRGSSMVSYDIWTI